MRNKKNVRMQNCLLQKVLQIVFDTVSDKMYIFRFKLKK